MEPTPPKKTHPGWISMRGGFKWGEVFFSAEKRRSCGLLEVEFDPISEFSDQTIPNNGLFFLLDSYWFVARELIKKAAMALWFLPNFQQTTSFDNEFQVAQQAGDFERKSRRP